MESKFKIEISKPLISHLRSFKHENHNFAQNYLETLLTLLQNIPKSYKAIESKNFPLPKFFLGLHFYISNIDNLEELYSEVPQMSKTQINNTNLMNFRSLWSSIESRISGLETKFDEEGKDSKFLEIATEFVKGELNIPMLELGINSTGKLYPEMMAYVAKYLTVQLSPAKEFQPLIFKSMNKEDSVISTLVEQYSKQAEKTFRSLFEFNFSEEKFNEYITNFVNYKNFTAEELINLNKAIENDILNSILIKNNVFNDRLETLLISLMGHPDPDTRESSIKSLNVLYDGVDWQLRASFKPKIKVAGTAFSINYNVKLKENEENNLFIILSAPSMSQNSSEHVISWHKPKVTKRGNFFSVQLSFGDFPKPGFYDWNLVQLKGDGKISGVYKIYDFDQIQKTYSGSFGSFSKLSTANITTAKPVQGRLIVQPANVQSLQVHEIFVDGQAKGFLNDLPPGTVGSFDNVNSNLSEYKEQGVNCLYLLGALQRDNGDEKPFRTNVSPLAVTNRLLPNLMLGGPDKFKTLMKNANELQMKILVDCVARVSSSRPNRKYKHLLIHSLDSEGKVEYCYGTDGRSLRFKDTSILNYRKKEAWDLLFEEVLGFAKEFGVDGIHLDNGQAWPQIFSLDTEELYRKEDGSAPAYSEREIFFGEFVKRDENSGYWGSQAMNEFANPMIMKLCKLLWKHFPNFIIMAEVWGGISTDDREFQIIRSGAIPRSFKIPRALSTLFGHKLRIDGQMSVCEKKSVHVFTQWYESFVKKLPPGSILAQSTTSTFWPSPAFLYERGTWAACDLIYFFPDIPMTFMGEFSGKSFRNAVTNIVMKIENTEPAKEKSFQSVSSFHSQKDVVSVFGAFGIMEEDKKFLESSLQSSRNRSGTSENYLMSERPVLNSDVLKGMEASFIQNLGPQYGFDLKKIGGHYKHRSNIRSKYEVLRKGKVITLAAEHEKGIHSHVLSFFRIYMEQIALITINFTDGPVHAFVNALNLQYEMKDYKEFDLILEFSSIDDEEKKFYYSLSEFINERHYMGLGIFKSSVWVGQILKSTPELKKLLIESAVTRIKFAMSTNRQVNSNYITDQLLKLLETNSIQEFISGFSTLTTKHLLPNELILRKFAHHMKEITNNPANCAKLFALSQAVGMLSVSHVPEHQQLKNVPGVSELISFHAENQLKTIAFATPEYGRWTTMGGIGVLLNEMLPELNLLGENVIVVTPFYRKKKETDEKFLELNKPGDSSFKHLFNFNVDAAGTSFTIGVHSGIENGVQIYFLSNYDIFPHVYVDGDAQYTMKQLTVYGKAVLQLFCCLGKFPDLIVNNDWFCGLIPAFAKRMFGGVFQNTKFIHIAHNLHPSYEGRMYPKKEEKSLSWIHGLPDYLLVDELWSNHIANPSRCALLETDNWATPFAYPNGIRIQERIKKIQEVCQGDHSLAKTLIQKNYFGFAQPDLSYCILSFVGRITEQKGVHLICEVAEDLIRKYPKVQFLVGGPATTSDKYGLHCYNYIKTLRQRYPHNFYGAPDSFFYDGALVNCGSNFGLMPSLFEPGGIVQHEFFVGGTPVIAFKTGGLRDTVHNYNRETKEGSGYVFENYNANAFKQKIEEALNIFFYYSDDYQKMRQNAFEATINLSDVAKAWDKEFYRMFSKVKGFHLDFCGS